MKKDDAVSRAYLLQKIQVPHFLFSNEYADGYADAIRAARHFIACAPVLDVGIYDAVQKAPALDERPLVHARWYVIHGYEAEGHVFCNECGYRINAVIGTTVLPNYCPDCGARMDAKE